MKWNEIYENEEQLIKDLKDIVIPTGNYNLTCWEQKFKGYLYIETFVKTLQSGKQLSNSQLVQAKRLASEIKKAKQEADKLQKGE